MIKKYSGAFRERRAVSVQEAFLLLMKRKGGADRLQLNSLWEHWKIVMGEDIAEMGMPIGHKGTTLLIGADDTMALQELSMMSDEILERANAFMDKEFFLTVKVHLLQGKRPLDQPKRMFAEKVPFQLPPRPENLGSLRHTLDPESPVGKCYQAYLTMYDKKP